MVLPEPLDRAEYANKFRHSQQVLVDATEGRLRWLRQLMVCIKDCGQAIDHARHMKKEIQLPSTDDLAPTHELLDSQLPLSIIVFGRSNTGKSTLLNQIMRQWPDEPEPQIGHLFPAAGHNCSARIAILCHGETMEARVVDPGSGDVLEQKPFETAQDIRPFMELTGDQRTDDAELRKLVKIQVPHKLLQGQLHLVDSPGMGENQSMNQVVRQFLQTVQSGIIVYVIDGKHGYKPDPDCENIKFLVEQHASLQKLIVANRVDFDFEAWFDDLPEPPEDCILGEDPLEDILEKLRDELGFHFTRKCDVHSQERLMAVRKQLEQRHPECLTGDDGRQTASLIGVSAKSVKELIAGEEQKLVHPPYVDSFLELESRLAALVLESGRLQLADSAQEVRHKLMLAKTLSTDFFCGQAERSDQMMRLLEKSIATMRDIFNNICKSLNRVLECDALDLSSAGSEINRLKMRYAHEDVSPEQRDIDASLMMREDEAKLIQSLVRAYGGSREGKAAIRLLCDFKDAVVSRMRQSLIWNYKMIFMVETNRPLSQLDARCKQLLDSLKNETAKVANGKASEEVIDFVKGQILAPDPEAFSKLCTTQLAVSMRNALDTAIRRDEFRRIVDTLTMQFNRNVEERERVLDYFMHTVDLSLQMKNVIHAYREQINERKVVVENLLSALLQNMREQKTHTMEEMQSMQSQNDKMAAMIFYIDALVTEATWTARYETSLQAFSNECTIVAEGQSQRRHTRQLTPRAAGGEALRLHYRLVQLRQCNARRLAADVAQISNRFAGQVRLSWLCLTDTYRSFMDADFVQLLIGFDGDCASLAELPPAELSDPDRLSWLASLLNFCAKLSNTGTYRPVDYRPSCVLLRRLRTDEIGSDSGDDGSCAGGCSRAAFPDPTRLLPDPGQASDAASLAACAVVLFTHEGPDDDGAAAGVSFDAEDRHGWDARHAQELRRLESEERLHYLAMLSQRLAARVRSRALVAAVRGCVRTCLEASDSASGRRGDGGQPVVEQLQGARQALLAALAGPGAAQLPPQDAP